MRAGLAGWKGMAWSFRVGPVYSSVTPRVQCVTDVKLGAPAPPLGHRHSERVCAGAHIAEDRLRKHSIGGRAMWTKVLRIPATSRVAAPDLVVVAWAVLWVALALAVVQNTRDVAKLGGT